MDISKISDIKYPDPIKFPLLKEKHAIIGPMSFEVLSDLEEEYGNLNKITEIFAAGNMDMKKILFIIWNMVENKEEFKDKENFQKYMPLAAANTLPIVIAHFMKTSLPEADEDEVTESGEEVVG